MSRLLISAARIRSVISDARTECDVVDALRRHGIPYTFSTDGGALHIRIISRSGPVQVVRSGSVPVPVFRSGSVPVPYRFIVPVPRSDD